uniref:Putative tail protein n=1 Tax=viral metagenome TaxID=1070528 RepID=A0A6H1Z9X7_9ZZZZ
MLGKNKVLITAITNPFQPYTSRITKVVDWKEEIGIQPYIKEVFSTAPKDLDIVASLNGGVIANDLIPHTIIKPGDNVVFCAVPHGPGGGKNILGLIAMIGLMLVAPYIAGPGLLGLTTATGALSITGKVVAGAIILGGSVLINAMLGPQIPDVPELGYGSPTYSWDVSQNIQNEGTPWSVIYGTARVYPPLIAKNTSMQGDKQCLNLLYGVADHAADSISEIEINDSGVENYSFYADNKPEIRLGDLDQPVIEYFNDTIDEVAVNRKLPASLAKTTWFNDLTDNPTVTLTGSWSSTKTTIGTDITYLRVECDFPNGWYDRTYVGGELDYYDEPATYTIEVRYSIAGLGSWTTKSVTGTTWGSYPGLSIIIPALSANQYDVQARITASDAEPECYVRWIGLGELALSVIEVETTGDAYDALKVGLLFPKGLYHFDGTQFSSVTVKISVEIRSSSAAVTDPWTGQTITVTESKNSAFRKTVSFEYLEHDEYNVRAFYAETPLHVGETGWMTECWFEYMQLILTDDFSYPGASLLAIKAVATDEVQGAIPSVSCLVKRLTVDVHNGSAWVTKPADNPAWIAYDMHVNDTYGYGISYTRMIYADFLSWANWCDDNDIARNTVASGTATGVGENYLDDTGKAWKTNTMAGWTLKDSASTLFVIESNTSTRLTVFGTPAAGAYSIIKAFRANIYFDTTRKFTQALGLIETLGWGRVVQKGTSFGVIMDKPGDPAQLFTIGNIKKDSFQINYMREENRANSLEVTYYDSVHEHTRQMVQVNRQDYEEDSDTNIEKSQIDLIGCTSRSLGIYHGQYMMACNQVLKKIVSFDVDIDAIACQVGNLIWVSHDVPQWGYSGRVVSATSNTVTIDREVTMQPDITYQIMVRHQTDVDADGYDDLETQTLQAVGVETTTDVLTLSDTWTNIPAADAVYTFGRITALAGDFRVINMPRVGDLSRKITALEYDVDVYTPDLPVSEDPPITDIPLVSNLEAREFFRWQDPYGRGFAQLTWRGIALKFYIWFKEKDLEPDIWTYWGDTTALSANIYDLNPRTTYVFAVSGTRTPTQGETIELYYYGYGAHLRPYAPVSGLRVKGEHNNENYWYGTDLTVTWNAHAIIWYDAGQEPVGAGLYLTLVTYTSFRYQVIDTATQTLMTEGIVNETEGTYTYAMNVYWSNALGLFQPRGVLDVKIWGRTSDGVESTWPAMITCTNPAPTASTGLVGISKIGGVQFTWSNNTERDFGAFDVRTKVETGAWSTWGAISTNSYFRHLTAAEIITYRKIRCTIYIQLVTGDLFAQWSGTSETGTSTSVGANYLTDTTKSWEVDEWADHILVDSTYSPFDISSNTADILTVSGTPASGGYMIFLPLQTSAVANMPFDKYMEISIDMSSGITGDEEAVYDGTLDSGGIIVT